MGSQIGDARPPQRFECPRRRRLDQDALRVPSVLGWIQTKANHRAQYTIRSIKAERQSKIGSTQLAQYFASDCEQVAMDTTTSGAFIFEELGRTSHRRHASHRQAVRMRSKSVINADQRTRPDLDVAINEISDL